ncbi:MAG: lipid-binding protein [Adhaeribacter sp.]
MNLKNIKIAFLGLMALTAMSCETLPDQEVETSAVYPIAGEWLTHVYTTTNGGTTMGPAVGATATNALGTLFAFRTYNTSDNVNNQAWLRLGTTQAVAILGKATVDVNALTISGSDIPNTATGKAGKTFTIQEGKVMLSASKQPSGATADSIYVRYTSTFDNSTYIITGHRRTAWAEDEY